ncbi:MAG: hypothetical protein ACLGI5_18310, partial [Thermoleophilia bacterium]
MSPVRSSVPIERRQPPPRSVADGIAALVVGLVTGCARVGWDLVRRPLLGVPAAVLAGLVAWLDAVAT